MHQCFIDCHSFSRVKHQWTLQKVLPLWFAIVENIAGFFLLVLWKRFYIIWSQCFLDKWYLFLSWASDHLQYLRTDLNKYLHLVVLAVRKAILNFVQLYKLFFWRGQWKTRLTFKQRSPLLICFDKFIFLMLSYQLAQNTANWPHLNRGIVLCLHQDKFRGSIPSTYDMTGHEARRFLR